MNGLRIHDVTLYLTEVPNRQGLAFVFMDGAVMHPVAYVSKKHEAKAREYWQRFLKGETGRVTE